jgi:uroporphyrinogen-III synthase
VTVRRVWVTRTEPGCSRQAKALEAAGYSVLAAPVLGVQKTDAVRPPGSFQYVFFLSEQAVHAAGDLSFCAGAEVFAVGAQTAAQLADRNIRAAVPTRASSEGLVEQIAQLTVAGAACLIVAGEQGRKTLREALCAASANVTEYLCYRRINLPVAAAHLSGVSHILVASQDGFRAMARLWCESGGDADVKVIAASDRIAALGPELGFQNLEVAAGAADADFIAALEAE